MAEPVIHIGGLGFPEGPVALPNGEIAFVDLLHQKFRGYRDGATRDIGKVEGSPNGMRLGSDGALYVANNGGLSPQRGGGLARPEPQISGRIQRLTLDGRVSDVAVDLPGERPWRPNDLVFSPEGHIVFTDPQNWEDLGNARLGVDGPAYRGGRLLLARLSGEVVQLAACVDFPNGLAFHPDGDLIVGLHVGHKLLRYPWRNGAVGEPSIWSRFDDRFWPDGMAFHDGRLYVAGADGDRIAVLDLSGRIVDMIATPARSVPTNLCVEGSTLWVTFGLSGELASYSL